MLAGARRGVAAGLMMASAAAARAGGGGGGGGSAGARHVLARGMAASSSAAPSPVTLWVLKYDYVPDILEKRAPHRAAHIGGLQKAAEEGTLVLGGALAEPVDTGLLVFTDKGVAERFVAQDPYVKQGLVTAWSVRQWMVVAGSKL